MQHSDMNLSLLQASSSLAERNLNTQAKKNLITKQNFETYRPNASTSMSNYI
jgi:hypothetical protein